MLTGHCHCTGTRWEFDGTPSHATACNCSICRRYGVLWIYGIDGETVKLIGSTATYVRPDAGELEFHFCPTCGNTLAWRSVEKNSDGKRQIAVNLRLVKTPEAVMDLPIRHFDGCETWKSVSGAGSNVRDMWF